MLKRTRFILGGPCLWGVTGVGAGGYSIASNWF